MAAISSNGPSKLHCKPLVASIAVLSFACTVPGTLHAGVPQEAPKAAQQDPRATAQEKRPGETLSERL
ncbi:MAG TPA: hypothetical protein VNR65_16875, partial [Geobacterales bacterium]|nr:hypothetical protein [Geobacterales bacterium]